MYKDKEKLIDEYRCLTKAIVFLKDGTVEKVEAPRGGHRT